MLNDNSDHWQIWNDSKATTCELRAVIKEIDAEAEALRKELAEVIAALKPEDV